MLRSGPVDRDVSNKPKRRRPRRCKHFGRNKCVDCPELNQTEENCDTFDPDACKEGPKDEDVQEANAD